ncbi:MAG: metal-sulfur cluster assembly factor [Patescibacteria group bacterium]
MANMKDEIKKRLKKVIDPELNISIIDLGLVYSIKIDKAKNVKITMTLTTIGCPLFPVIENDIKQALKDLKLKDLELVLTFDPPWTMDMMSKESKLLLGFLK